MEHTATCSGRTRREGYDLDARYAVLKERGSEVALLGNYSAVNAYRLDGSHDFVQAVPVYTANLGADSSLAMGGGEPGSSDKPLSALPARST